MSPDVWYHRPCLQAPAPVRMARTEIYVISFHDVAGTGSSPMMFTNRVRQRFPHVEARLACLAEEGSPGPQSSLGEPKLSFSFTSRKTSRPQPWQVGCRRKSEVIEFDPRA